MNAADIEIVNGIKAQKSSKEIEALLKKVDFLTLDTSDAESIKTVFEFLDDNYDLSRYDIRFSGPEKAAYEQRLSRLRVNFLSDDGFNQHAEIILGYDNFNVNTLNSKGLGLLHISNNSKDLIFLLEQQGIDINLLDSSGNTLLISVCEKWRSDKFIEMFFSHKDIDVNKPTPDGKYPLFIAFQNHRHKVAKRLLQHPDIDVAKAEGKTGSFLNGYLDDLEIIQLLLEKRAFHKIKGWSNKTIEAVFDLLEKKPNLRASDIRFYGYQANESFARLAALTGQTFFDFYQMKETNAAIYLLEQMERIDIKTKTEAEALFALIEEKPVLLEKPIFCQPDEEFINWDEFRQKLMEQRENRLLDFIEYYKYGVNADALLALEDISLDKVLLSCVKYLEFDCFQKILKHERVNVNARSDEDQPLLHLVLNLKDEEYIKLLLQVTTHSPTIQFPQLVPSE